MIDTIKIYTMISKNVYDKIYNSSIIKTSYSKKDGQIFYEIVNDKLEGSYSNSLSVRVGSGIMYKFVNMYYLEIEGSYHKIMKGYNSHEGFYNLQVIVNYLIGAIEYAYSVKLPSLKHWFLQRLDIALCFDLGSNENVRKYINNLNSCDYPRRKNFKFCQDESIYLSGTTTTLKIYNKKLEFRKHDMKKLYKYSINLENYLKEIDGFVRFECEIKKKKLRELYNCDYIRVVNVNYEDFKKVWCDEFMKLLKFFESDLTVVRNKDEIRNRLELVYGKTKGNNLYAFYSALMLDGFKEVKKNTSRTSFYRKVKELTSVNIDISQKYKIDIENDTIDFNPFTWKEVM